MTILRKRRSLSMLLALLLAAALPVALLTGCSNDDSIADTGTITSSGNSIDTGGDTQPAGDPLFILNGVSYYTGFTVQNLVDNGWVLGEGTGFIETAAETKLAYVYRMNSGESQIIVTLSEDAIKHGADPLVCNPVTVNMYGDGATSFVVSGAELIGVTGTQLVERLGAPNQTQGFTRIYFEPVNGIDVIMFSFTDAQSSVDQITVGIKR